MFLKTIDWKLIWKFYVTIICGLYFDRSSTISCEKYDEKNVMITDTLAYYWMCTTIKITELLKGLRTVIR